jgi:Glu-tRNA(Gln) amidotransferase subunit E-like FAD-binding protein
MSHEAWHKGHREVRNVIHNEMGVTKEEIQEIFRTIAKDEISKIMGEEREFIRNNIRVLLKEVIKGEMLSVLDYENFPKVIGHTWHYYQDKGNDFKNFILNVMKTEIIDELRDCFDINLEFNTKKKEAPKKPETSGVRIEKY